MTDKSITVIIGIVLLIIIFGLYVILPAKMAKKRGRSAIGWILFFLITSPICGIIVLLIVGDSKEKIRKDIIEELHRDY